MKVRLERVKDVAETFGHEPAVMEIVEFIEAGRSPWCYSA